MTDLLAEAVRLAAAAHKGQKDKAGAPYILHPLRVMAAMETPVEMMTAVLHDVLEDTAITLEELRERQFPAPVLEALVCLTRQPLEDYDDYIDRVKQNPLATKVKKADLRDNLDKSRIVQVTEKDLARWAKYERARRRLLGEMAA